MKAGRRTRNLAATLAFAGGTVLASACGFEDPKGADAARGVINWAYPEALHVTSAVWRAQLEGVIERDDRPHAVRALLGYRQAAVDLAKLRDRLEPAMGSEAVPGLSILLIGPMLWSRFTPTRDGLGLATHVEGAQPADIVIVSDEAVIAALVAGRLTPHAARQRGLIRLYGPPDGQALAAEWLDRLASSSRSIGDMPRTTARNTAVNRDLP